MSRPRLSPACAALLALALTSCGGAGGPEEIALAQGRLQGSGSGFPGLFDAFTLWTSRASDPASRVGDARPFTAADAGMSVSFTASDDPEFAALASALTNGADDLVELHQGSPGGSANSTGAESGLLTALGPDVLDPDLAGFTLTRIEFRVDALAFSHPMGTTSYSYDVRVIFHGTRN